MVDDVIEEILNARVTLREGAARELVDLANVLLAPESSAVIHLPMFLAQDLGVVILKGIMSIEEESEDEHD